MIVEPKIRGFICTTAHPKGCFAHVMEQIDYVKAQERIEGPKNVLVIGASTGYGLSSRIAAAAGSGAATLGVFFEKEAKKGRTATAGWYNTAAFEEWAKGQGLYAKSVNGDAYSHQVKEEVIRIIKEEMGKIDLLIYSLASPRRTDPVTGETYHSVLKPIGEVYSNKTIDIMTKELSQATIEPAQEEEIQQTIRVMGGEDWLLWIEALKAENLLAEDIITCAYSYVGPTFTFPIYREGTIGRAKDHLEKTASDITGALKDIKGRGYVAVNKALVTQASSAIPVVPLYISALFKVMKAQGSHEGCIEQMYRLLKDRLYSASLPLDEQGRIRLDDYEMAPQVQEEVTKLFLGVNKENLEHYTDLDGYQKDFLKLFGFGLDNVDYLEDVEVEINIPSIKITE